MFDAASDGDVDIDVRLNTTAATVANTIFFMVAPPTNSQ
jgi:hypothetical protein